MKFSLNTKEETSKRDKQFFIQSQKYETEDKRLN